jgi:hypothetical protein
MKDVINLNAYRVSRGGRTMADPATVTMDGMTYNRIPAGSGFGHDAGPCFECSAGIGELHVLGCDVERCPDCLGQLVVCRRGGA